MSALIGDVVSGEISPATTNAACNAAGKLLKIVEMEQKYGSPNRSGKTLQLAAN